jgi:hypothetical protein
MFKGIRRKGSYRFLLVDMVMVALLVVNLVWIICTWLYAGAAFRDLLDSGLPRFSAWYGAEVHPNFIFIDLAFVAVFLADFLVGWIVAALGAVQGGLLLVLIGLRYRSRYNLPLVLLLFAFAVRLGTIPAWNPEGLLSAPWLLPVAGAAPLLFGPLIWWYVRALFMLIIVLDEVGFQVLVVDLFS